MGLSALYGTIGVVLGSQEALFGILGRGLVNGPSKGVGVCNSHGYPFRDGLLVTSIGWKLWSWLLAGTRFIFFFFDSRLLRGREEVIISRVRDIAFGVFVLLVASVGLRLAAVGVHALDGRHIREQAFSGVAHHTHQQPGN
jgi:hypothetical protein